MRNYNEIEKSGRISEREILTIKSRLNRGKDEDEIFNMDTVLTVSEDQAAKGIAWLTKKLLRKDGEYRKYTTDNNLEDIADKVEFITAFELADWMNIGRFFPFYVPVYSALDKYGLPCFSYYVEGGELKRY